jgi:hypothetical protein
MGRCFLCHEARMCLVHKDLLFCLLTDFTALQMAGASVRLPVNHTIAK